MDEVSLLLQLSSTGSGQATIACDQLDSVVNEIMTFVRLVRNSESCLRRTVVGLHRHKEDLHDMIATRSSVGQPVYCCPPKSPSHHRQGILFLYSENGERKEMSNPCNDHAMHEDMLKGMSNTCYDLRRFWIVIATDASKAVA